MTAAPVLIIGSANVDVSVSAATLPRPGETVMGSASLISLGGKGANQAVAAAACGAATEFVGRVGDDEFGRMLVEGLRARRVGLDGLGVVAGAATGMAAISVEDSGLNCIVVVPGANECLTPASLDAIVPLMAGAAVVVVQCEIPLETMYRVLALAHAHGKPTILNPAPYRGLDLPRIAGLVTYLVPNETEAAQAAARATDSVDLAEDCAAWLQAQGAECVIITLGSQGCVVADRQPARHYPGHQVKAIDTTGAGDAFVGCLAASLAQGAAREQAIRRALLYSALSTTKRGAQSSYPTHREFEAAWSAQRCSG